LSAELDVILSRWSESPCDGCHLRRKCADAQLACERFSMFSHGEARSRWINAPRAPTRARFEALFGLG
jgi:hypothetical protein